jgi:hypothetical protein
MLIVRTVKTKMGGGQKLIDFIKANPKPGAKLTMLRPESGYMRTLVLVSEFESYAAWEKTRDSFSPPGLREVWLECVESSTVQFYREVE